MSQKVVTLKRRAGTAPPVQSSDIWHHQINLRLSQIERMLKRLEWQVWTLLCGGSAVVAVSFIDRLLGR